jgi:hypothetical protein
VLLLVVGDERDSSDGAAWTPVPARSVGSNGLTMSAELAAPGSYVATTTLPELTAGSASTGSHTSSIVLGVIVAVVALVLFGVAFVVVRRRTRRSKGAQANESL